MEFIHTNKIVMLFINKIVIASKKINRPSPSQVNGQKIEKGRRQGKEDKRLKEEKKDWFSFLFLYRHFRREKKNPLWAPFQFLRSSVILQQNLEWSNVSIFYKERNSIEI